MLTTSSRRLQFGEAFELDLGAYELRRASRAVRLPRIPMEVLLLLIERRGNLVTREQIIERIWGKEVFVDTDNSINAAIRKIRRALRDDSDEPRYIQTVTGLGYRFIAAVSEVEIATPDKAVVPPSEAVPKDTAQRASDNISSITAITPIGRKREFPSWRLWAPATAAVVLILLAATLYRAGLRTQSSSPSASARVMLAVLPFDNLTGDAAQEYFSDGMTEEMITDLGMLDPQHLGVIARTSVMLYKHTPKPIDQIGRELGVQYVMEGSVRRDSRNVRITAQLIQVKDQSHIWARQYDREVKDLLTVQAEIARECADQVRLILGDQRQVRTPTGRVVTLVNGDSYESYDLYLKGRYYWNKRRDGLEQAADYFQQAIGKDPNNARAYAGLADTFALMSTYFMAPEAEYMPKARAAALKALQLDDSLAEAHASLGLIVENSQYDWETAEKEFRRAIQLNPHYATAHQWYAEHLAWRGRFDEAFAESERARQLDPLSVIIAADHCKILYFSRQYDRAIAHCRAVLQMDPRANGAQGFIFGSLIEQGKFADAEQQITVPTQDPIDLIWASAKKAYLYGRWGRTNEAEQFLASVEENRAQLSYSETAALLLAYCGAGTSDQVVALLQKAYAHHSSVLGSMKVDPIYDRFRSDPRFQELLHRVGVDR